MSNNTNPSEELLDKHPIGPKEKKWKHYLFEFLFLFLAVTAGFFVDNQREHYSEQKSAIVYAKAMRINLQSDTSELKQIVSRNSLAVNYLDAFLDLAAKDSLENIPTGELYWYGLWGGYYRGFESNDATFQQMKNSGSLRYFDNNTLVQSISDYDQLVRSIYLLNQIDHSIFIETRKARAKLFDFRFNRIANNIVQQFGLNPITEKAIDSFIALKPPLLTKDRIIFNEYVELCRSRNLGQVTNNYKRSLELATNVIVQLENEYNLK